MNIYIRLLKRANKDLKQPISTMMTCYITVDRQMDDGILTVGKENKGDIKAP